MYKNRHIYIQNMCLGHNVCTKNGAISTLKNIHRGQNDAITGPRGHLLMPPHGPHCSKEWPGPHAGIGGSTS